MKWITAKRIEADFKNNAIRKVYIDGRTVITKSACIFAEEHDIDLVLINDPVVNKKHLEATLHPEKYIADFVRRVHR